MRAAASISLAAPLAPGLAAAQPLPEALFIPRLDPHHRRGSLPIPTPADLGIALVFNLYRRAPITPDLGSLSPMKPTWRRRAARAARSGRALVAL